jgi:ABC-type nickel/cobalt efflux system permease component RcnA
MASIHGDYPMKGLGLAAATLAIALLAWSTGARADTVASLLGNFTINQFCGLLLDEDSLNLHYAVVFGQLPALAELHQADANHDGVTSQAERDAYVQQRAPAYANQLQLFIDGAAIPLHLTHAVSSLPTEQGGFSLRLDADFVGALPPGLSRGTHTLRFVNANFDGRFGWHEITIQAPPGIQVFDTNGFSSSLTGGLTEALQSLPPQGPLDERTLNLSFTRGVVPAGSISLGPRAGLGNRVGSTAALATPAIQGSNNGENPWLQRQTRALVQLISTPAVPWHVTLLALLVASVLGALHAFSPGHGKTIVGAYLIGSRGTARHAAFLGLTVTVTHTLGVFVLGFATLFASRFIVPERLFPVLSLVSGLIVLGMGMVLLAARWRRAHDALVGRGVARRWVSPGHEHPHGHGHGHDHVHTADHIHDHVDDHDHDHDHEHGHQHLLAHEAHSHWHTGALVHSHGGSVHSHLPPGADGTEVTWRGLLALGISGGLIPCPSAMVLLLAAVALNKTAYGMLLVLGFSIGLAVTLTGVGLAFVYARSRLPRPTASARWPLVLPVVSAAAVTVLGFVLCFGALQSARW